MKNYTTFIKGNKTTSRMAGLPKTIQVFDKRSSECDVIKIERFLFEESAYPVETIYLSKVGEKWVSTLSLARSGYMRYELVPKLKNYTLQQVEITEEEGKAIIEECTPLQMEEAKKIFRGVTRKMKRMRMDAIGLASIEVLEHIA